MRSTRACVRVWTPRREIVRKEHKTLADALFDFIDVRRDEKITPAGAMSTLQAQLSRASSIPSHLSAPTRGHEARGGRGSCKGGGAAHDDGVMKSAGNV